MKDNQGLLIAALVAVVAIVGLVLLMKGGASGAATTGDMHCQLVVSDAGVGSFLCRTNLQYPQFTPQYLDEQRKFGLFDQFGWDGS